MFRITRNPPPTPRLFWPLWVSIFGLFGGAGLWAQEAELFAPDENRIYKTVGEVNLALNIFYPEGHRTTDLRSAAVFFFGGGWKVGTPSQFFPHCEYLAARGMVAITADYRVASRHGTSPIECIKDAKSAMRWLRQHAEELGIDPAKIVAGGGSAGGHLAAATALIAAYDEETDDLRVSPRPSALLLFNPVYDNGPGGYGYDRVQDYWETFSPMNHIDHSVPPAVVFLGTRDGLIPVSTAMKFKRLMEEQGVRSDLHLYEGQKHGFFNHQYPKYFVFTVAEMDRFLVSLGFLPALESSLVNP